MSEQVINSRHRIIAMIPTEIYVDAVDSYDAASIMEWLFEQYPSVSYPVSSETNSVMEATAKVLAIEGVDENDAPEE